MADSWDFPPALSAHIVPERQIAQTLGRQQLQVVVVPGQLLHYHVDRTGGADKVGNVFPALLEPVAKPHQVQRIAALSALDTTRQSLDFLLRNVLDHTDRVFQLTQTGPVAVELLFAIIGTDNKERNKVEHAVPRAAPEVGPESDSW
uniref:Uncharacterized protein n=1 Tax=Anopheles coluzzii TaxID=1518534 RepID=A0A8W7PE31_ANOCL